MTIQDRNAWAQYLEGASQKEIMQMAEYAIDHLDPDKLKEIRHYIVMAIGMNK